MLTEEDKILALLSHILCLIVGFLAPLIIWLIKKDQSVYISEHAQESLNFQISVIIYSAVAGILCLVFIGFLLLPLIGIATLILIIIASIKAYRGEMYRYPLTIRLIK
ncbi:hypothetical protein SAMN03159341_10929 [Paenibacillus sp. 1_12]|uniref:DUF4870 domain-containing protein n=1 Tax=Paenibacillus sp. 1_12 TaxID=1566278 RepID=UPI0008F458C0|nr:DUF4870 domain-containing protein [Paenibacillus sp. 1_12]SFL72813.1 hypothetical protein SAMN03159341_10929 [Paenibacillus sp. 1_12]